MEKIKLTPEQIGEVNERVSEIMSSFKEGLKNSSAFDFGNYWRFGLEGNGMMSDACKYVHDTKKRVISMIEKEEMLVCREIDSLFEERQRVVKNNIINSLMTLLAPALRGRGSEHVYIKRAASIAEYTMNQAEILLENKFKK
jgi:hypothetical protein